MSKQFYFCIISVVFVSLIQKVLLNKAYLSFDYNDYVKLSLSWTLFLVVFVKLASLSFLVIYFSRFKYWFVLVSFIVYTSADLWYDIEVYLGALHLNLEPSLMRNLLSLQFVVSAIFGLSFVFSDAKQNIWLKIYAIIILFFSLILLLSLVQNWIFTYELCSYGLCASSIFLIINFIAEYNLVKTETDEVIDA